MYCPNCGGPLAREPQTTARPTTVLWVDDDRLVLGACVPVLERHGYRVLVATDGAAGIATANQERPDAILLDVMMPTMTGFEVCQQLRADPNLKDTPIILLTALTHEAEKVMGLEVGADDYVTKPFSHRELRARIKAVLRRAAGELPDVYRFGDVEVDFSRGELRRAGRPVETTVLEFKLLTALVRNEGRLLSRGQILDAVWGPGTHVIDRVVDNHVLSLRRKIEPDPQRPRYLISIRGMGYRFEGEHKTES